MVYLIQSGTYLKIGYTTDIINRFKAYVTSNPEVYLLSVIEGDMPLEKYLHKKFEKYKYKNEWFHHNIKILEEFDKLSISTATSSFYTFERTYSNIFKINSVITLKVLMKLCCILKCNSDIVNLNNKMALEIANELGFSFKDIYDSIMELNKLDIVYMCNGEWRINPAMFWRGDLDFRDYILDNNINIPTNITNDTIMS